MKLYQLHLLSNVQREIKWTLRMMNSEGNVRRTCSLLYSSSWTERNHENPQSWAGSFWSEDGGSMVLRNAGILPRHYTASQRRRPRLEFSTPWELQISYRDLNTDVRLTQQITGLWSVYICLWVRNLETGTTRLRSIKALRDFRILAMNMNENISL
jgi:hypothetical protein